MTRHPTSWCELCEAEFEPLNKHQDGILCPPCDSQVERSFTETNRLEWSTITTGLVYKKPHRATAADYQAMSITQGGACAICGYRPEVKPLVIDHNHRTGEVRGLLCNDCNTGLGALGDHPEILRRAAVYLAATSYYGSFPRPPETVRARKPRTKAG